MIPKTSPQKWGEVLFVFKAHYYGNWDNVMIILKKSKRKRYILGTLSTQPGFEIIM